MLKLYKSKKNINMRSKKTKTHVRNTLNKCRKNKTLKGGALSSSPRSSPFSIPSIATLESDSSGCFNIYKNYITRLSTNRTFKFSELFIQGINTLVLGFINKKFDFIYNQQNPNQNKHIQPQNTVNSNVCTVSKPLYYWFITQLFGYIFNEFETISSQTQTQTNLPQAKLPPLPPPLPQTNLPQTKLPPPRPPPPPPQTKLPPPPLPPPDDSESANQESTLIN